MNREMYKKERQMSPENAAKIFSEGNHGTLAVNGDDGYPYAVPVNYVFIDGKIYIHSAKYGYKIDALKQNDKVCFTAILNSQIIPDKFTAAFESVVAFGKASFIDDGDEKLTALRTFIERFSPDHQEAGERFIHAAYEKTQIIRIDVEQMTGKAYRPGNKWD